MFSLLRKTVIKTVLPAALSAVTALSAAEQQTEVINLENTQLKQKGFVLPGPRAEYYLDKSGQAGIDEILQKSENNRFKKNTSRYPNFGITDAVIWLKFKVKASDYKDLLLEVAAPNMQQVSVYIIDGQGSLYLQQSSLGQTLSERVFRHQNYIFSLDPGGNYLRAAEEYETSADTGGREVYIRTVATESVTLPLFIWHSEAFYRADVLRTFAFGLFFGLMAVMAFYNFFLFLSIRDRAYLYYIFYIIFFSLFFAWLYGQIQMLLPPLPELIRDRFAPLMSVSTAVMALAFARRFLLFSRYSHRLQVISTYTLAAGAALIPVLFAVHASTAVTLANLYPQFSIILVVAGAIHGIRSGFTPAKYFLLAWAVLLAGVSLFILSNLGLIPAGFTIQYGQLFGAGLEAILLSLALGYRINSLKQSEEEARRKIIEEQQKALEKQKSMAESFSRFVPHEFLEHLGRDSIENITRGDVVQRQMTVLFADIRDFTAFSEKTGSEKTFSFLNSYLETLTPLILKHNGFIDKFIGDAIMALFNKPDDAAQAALAMKQAIKNIGAVEAGIGLHHGEVMLGTVGSEERLETTVIGDTVNLAARIESANKQYSTVILASETVTRDLPAGISTREIDSVYVKGRSEPVVLYEILS